MESKNIKVHKSVRVKFFFIILFWESLITFLALALQPSAPENRIVFLYSAPRFLELVVILLMTTSAGWGMRKMTTEMWQVKVTSVVAAPRWKGIFIFGGISIFIISCLGIILLRFFAEIPDLHYLLGYANHLLPLFVLFSLIGFEISIWAILINREKIHDRTLIIWSLLSLATVFSIFLGFFYTPIFGWSIFLIWSITTSAIMVCAKERKIKKKGYTHFIAMMVAISAFVFLGGLQSIFRPYAQDNFYFQEWSSEKMMHTVSLKDLQNTPWETLNNIHTSPPGMDFVRAVFLRLWPAPDLDRSLLHVDFLLYQLRAVLYSLLGGLTFLWLSILTDKRIALLATFALLLHPALLLYATLLDTSFLTAFLIFSLYYLLEKIKNKSDMPVGILITLTLALFFTRSIFQFPFLILITLSLLLFGVQKQKILIFLVITGAVVGLFSLKQYQQFGTISTSSFAGMNLNRSVGNQNYIDYWNLDIDYKEQDSSLPKTLTRIKKINGSPNYNHIQYIEFNQELIKNYKEYILTTHPSEIFKSYWENLNIYFRPSSMYNTKHEIVDRLPWKNFYDSVFSFPILNILLLLSSVWWLQKTVKRKDYISSIGLLLPGLYIFLSTVLFEKGENMRFKFFLEPVLFVFIISQLYDISQKFLKEPHVDKSAIL